MQSYQYAHTVGFSEVDAAGIVFFSRFFEIAHRALESFFHSLDLPFATVMREDRWAFPLVHAGADFHNPARLGDTLGINLTLDKLSKSSFTVRYEIQSGDSRPLATVRTAHVWLAVATFSKASIPDDLHTRLILYCADKSPD
ncbi:acyl-CoA thioesterase [Candidatus Neomarinimicrobiota bacterium]